MSRKFRFPSEMLIPFHKFLDTVLGAGTLLLLYYVFFPSSFVTKTPQIALIAVTSMVLTLVCFHVAGVYKEWSSSDLVSECNRIVTAIIFVFAGMLILGYSFKVSSLYSRRVVLSWFAIWPVILCCERIFIKKVFFKWFYESGLRKSAVIVGAGRLGMDIFKWVEDNPWAGIEVKGFFDREDSLRADEVPSLGLISELPDFVKKHKVQLVYLALPMREEDLLTRLLKDLEDSTAQIFFSRICQFLNV